MDWRRWIEQRIPFTEIQRGGAAAWPRGARGLIGDSLGPVMHLHDGASEIFFFIAGRCRLEVGNSEELFAPGDFVLVPPEVPHNLWNADEEDLLVFWIVAPNIVANKWRTENFPAGAMDRRAVRGRVMAGGALPGDHNIRSRLLTVPGHSRHAARTAEKQEAVLYFTQGGAEVRVGKFTGTLTADEFVHVPVGTHYLVATADVAATILLFEMPTI